MEPIAKEAWAEGVQHELGFWEHWLTTGGHLWPDDFARRFDPESELDIDAEHMTVPTSGAIDVLDVGSGPVTDVGKRLPGVEVRIVAVDPLADEYNRLLDRVGLEPPVRPIRGDAENLLAAVGDRRFDIVRCHNALDHAYDPLRALNQMVDAAKPGGDIVLDHWENEGEREGYEGLHSWNFTIEDGRFLIWREGERLFPDEHLHGVDWVRAVPRDEWVVVFIRKSA